MFVEAGTPYSLYSSSDSTATYYIVIISDSGLVLEYVSFKGNASRVDFTPSNSGWLCFDIHINATEIMIQSGPCRNTEYSEMDSNTYGITLNKAKTRVPTYNEYTENLSLFEKRDHELYGRTTDIEYLSGVLITSGETTLLSRYVARGGVDSGVVNLDWDYRAYTVPILVFAFDVAVSCATTHRMRIALYDDGVYQSRIDWTTKYTVPAGTEFRLTIRNYPEDTTVEMDIESASNAVTLTYNGFMPGVGDSLYYGNPIRIETDFENKNRCDIQLWKDFTNTDDSWKAYDTQSMAIFGNYMFLLNSDGAGFVVDMTEKNVVGTLTMPSIANNHQNAAQFSAIFYDNTDEFPLLFVSHKDSNTEYAEVLIYRILRNNSLFSVTKVNTITWRHVAYGGSVIVDNSGRMLNFVTYLNGGYNVAENNPVIVASFKLPTDSQILSGEQIVITDDDIISCFTIDHVTLQDGCSNGGFLYQCVTDENETSQKQFIYAIDVRSGRVSAKVRLLNNLEVEGVSVHGGMMYVIQRRGATNGNDNPLKAYMIQFA